MFHSFTNISVRFAVGRLRKPKLWAPSIMVNVLGEHVAPLTNAVARITRIGPSILYGKAEAKEKRKMGHVTIMTDNIEQTLEEIDASGIWPV